AAVWLSSHRLSASLTRRRRARVARRWRRTARSWTPDATVSIPGLYWRRPATPSIIWLATTLPGVRTALSIASHPALLSPVAGVWPTVGVGVAAPNRGAATGVAVRATASVVCPKFARQRP